MISPVFIAALPYFVGLKPEEIEDIRRAVFEKTCDRNEVIAMEGEPCQAVYFVAKGSVKIVKGKLISSKLAIAVITSLM